MESISRRVRNIVRSGSLQRRAAPTNPRDAIDPQELEAIDKELDAEISGEIDWQSLISRDTNGLPKGC